MEEIVIPAKLTSWLTINRDCNLRCSWCYAKMTGFKSQDSMSLRIVKKSVGLLKDLGLKSVILIGGEPTLHPNFIEIVEMIKKEGLEVYLVTNAIKFDDNDFLMKTLSAGVSSITISFKASNRKDYQISTQKDYFLRAMQAIKNIADAKISNVVNVTVCESLIENFDEMINVVCNSGAKVFSIDTGKPIILNGKTYVNGLGSPKQLAQFFIKTYSKLKDSGLRFSVKIAIPFCLFPKKFIDKVILDGNILTGCQMVRGRGIIIDPDGNLIPCNHICDQSLGKIGNDFTTAREYGLYRQRKEVKDFYEIVSSCPTEKCVKCDYWTKCGAGCKLYWMYYDEVDLIGNFK